MITKVLDGVFVFLSIKLCHYVWNHLFPNEVLEVLENRINYLEDELNRLLEAVQ